jgi:hypothetical protein
MTMASAGAIRGEYLPNGGCENRWLSLQGIEPSKC